MRFPKSDVSHWKSARHRKYYGMLFAATPHWLSDAQREAYHAIYRKARNMRRRGWKVQVDHIVPICSDTVCGLNVPWNLAIVCEKRNMSKGNRHWPDHQGENLDMFDGLGDGSKPQG